MVRELGTRSRLLTKNNLWHSDKRPRLDRLASLRVLLLAVVASLSAYVYWYAMSSSTNGGLAPPLDDSFIYFQYAKSIATGHVFSYIPGDPPTTGATGFLYPFLLAAGYWLGAQGESIIIFAYLLNAVLLFITSFTVYKLASHFVGAGLAILGGLAVLVGGPILWGFFSLMEIGLFAAVIVSVSYFFVKERNAPVPWLTLALAVLLPFCRPEGVLMALLVFGAVSTRYVPALLNRGGRWWRDSSLDGAAARDSSGGRGRFLRSGLYGLALLLPVFSVIGYLALVRLLSGSFTTNTFASKAVQTLPLVPWFEKLGMMSGNAAVLLQSPFGLHPVYLPILVFPLFVLGIGRAIGAELRHRQVGLGILGLGLVIAAVVTASQLPSAHVHHFRYIIALFPLAIVFVVIGIGQIRLLTRDGEFLYLGVAALVLVLLLINYPQWIRAYAENTRDIYFQQVSVAHWIQENIPEDEIVAINDAGAIAYYGERRVYDLVGLVTNDASIPYRHGTGAVFERLNSLPEEERPTYFAIYPHWFGFPGGRFLNEQFRTHLHAATIAGGHSVVVYQADYSIAEGKDVPLEDHSEGGQWRLVDSLNIADLNDEAAHDYRQRDYIPRGPKAVTILRELGHAADSRRRVLDGGRIILGAEEFTVSTEPHQDMKVVMRTDAGFSVTLDVYANNQYVGEWSFRAQRDAWIEPTFIVPGSFVSGEQTELKLELQDNILTARDYASFHYWFYQPAADVQVNH